MDKSPCLLSWSGVQACGAELNIATNQLFGKQLPEQLSTAYGIDLTVVVKFIWMK